MFNTLVSLFLAGLSTVMGVFGITVSKGEYRFTINSSDEGRIIDNPVSNVNVWEMGTAFFSPNVNKQDDIFDFVEYVQLMQCTGGTYQRDLFEDPYDTTVLDDYKFDRLIKNCRGIVSLGAKPCLKIGNVPMKYSKNAHANGMECNVLPPDDYDVYYNYLTALFQALVDEFGREEVLKWHFTAFTEYENYDWFQCETPEKSCEETCRMYDYIVDALQKTIGEYVCVGAHSMTVTEGGWDEALFIKHCAVGTNYKTGEKGTRICYLTASYYESNPGNVGDRFTLPETIEYLRSNAEKYGLTGLKYGIDEGRVLCGTVSGKSSDQLVSRTVGYIWQAGFDARLYGQMLDSDISYFSHWSYYSEGLLNGVPTLNYHVSKHMNKFAGSRLVPVETEKKGYIYKADVKAYSAYNDETSTLHVMAFNYKNDLAYSEKAKIKLEISVPQFKTDKVKVTAYYINDDCNYYDEFLEDMETYGITNEDFGWSPQCPCIGSNMNNPEVKKIYKDILKAKYAECAVLTPVTYELPLEGDRVTVNATLGGNNVVFFEISE